jgi:hypothetical protein
MGKRTTDISGEKNSRYYTKYSDKYIATPYHHIKSV